MYKYDGLLIHESHDDEGIIEVIEREGVRSLHFGSHPRQSSMLLTDPDKLELEYVRAMTSWLLFKPTLDDDALIVGLGGGSLTKHLLQHFPVCRLKVVEFRKSVVKIARSYFGLPLDPRLKIIIDDGGDYIRQRADTYRERYSLLFIDAFDHEGMASSICSEAFFDDCKALLKKHGILVINLWGGNHNPEFQQVSLWLARVFNRQTLFLPVRDRDNVIALAFNDYSPLYSMKELRTNALALEQHYQIEFPAFLQAIKRRNASTLNQVIKT
ncbi:MAG: spermine synthase [Methylococcales bacterium]|nr:spermine synthase [Methylococcales bacterium]